MTIRFFQPQAKLQDQQWYFSVPTTLEHVECAVYAIERQSSFQLEHRQILTKMPVEVETLKPQMLVRIQPSHLLTLRTA